MGREEKRGERKGGEGQVRERVEEEATRKKEKEFQRGRGGKGEKLWEEVSGRREERREQECTVLARGSPKLCQHSITCSIAREVARKPPAREKG